jgi:GNAT superfamily N-acetyltransferase
MTEIRSVRLDDGRVITVRHGGSEDVPDLVDLYQRLSVEDRQRRFFSGAFPPRETVKAWAEVADRRGGVLLIAEELAEDGSSSVVGEAGFAPLDDGDAELGITVDRKRRGWLGPWLLDALLEAAADVGIPNLQALTAARNTQMHLMLCRRGAAGIPDDDWTNVRLTVSTSGRVPSWRKTSGGRQRLLVEANSHQWTGTSEANRRGFDVTVCRGPSANHDHYCPVLEGERCPLVEGADAVLFSLSADGNDDLLAAHNRRRTGAPLFVKSADETTGEVLHRIQNSLDDGLTS